jgi:hypothetical protein
MTRRRTLGAALAAAGLVVLLLPTTTALSALAQRLTAPPEAPVAVEPDPGAAIPQLSERDAARALEIVAADPNGKRFLRNRAFTVAEIGPWTTENQVLVGASMVLALDAPASFAMTQWPAIDYHGQGARPFERGTIPAAATGVTELHVRVDLADGSVVSVEPGGPAAVVTPGPGIQRREPRDPGR